MHNKITRRALEILVWEAWDDAVPVTANSQLGLSSISCAQYKISGETNDDATHINIS